MTYSQRLHSGGPLLCTVQPSPEGRGGQKRRAGPGWGDEAPQSPGLQRGLWCEQPAGLFVGELMGQIETSREMDGQMRRTHAQFYKLERVVVVDPQTTVMAAVTQKEVTQHWDFMQNTINNHNVSMSAPNLIITDHATVHNTFCSCVTIEISYLRTRHIHSQINTEPVYRNNTNKTNKTPAIK